MHFGCANEFLGLYHACFLWGFALRCGTYWWFSSPGRCPDYFGHFVFMYSSSTFLSHRIIPPFLCVSFGKFWQENYASMWGHYGSRIMKIFSRPLNKVSCLITDILWWYKPFLYGGLCPIYFSRELDYNGFVFVL